jgi:hypothetical protein
LWDYLRASENDARNAVSKCITTTKAKIQPLDDP